MSASRFTYASRSNPCPICSDTKGKCRTNSESLVFCGHPPQYLPTGWKQIPAKNPVWAVFAPDDGSSSQSWQDRLEAYNKRKSAREQEDDRRRAENPAASVEERDRGYRALLAMLPKQLNAKDRADLARRGVTDEQIEQWQIRSIDQWQKLPDQIGERLAGISEGGRSLSNGYAGYIVPIEDPSGRVTGFQVWNRNKVKGDNSPKYPWFTSKTKRNPNGATANFANGELPLAVAFPKHLDPNKLGQIGLCEATGVRVRIAADALGIPFIGGSGGHYGEHGETLLSYIKQIQEILSCVNLEDLDGDWLSRSRKLWRNTLLGSNSTKTATETVPSPTVETKISVLTDAALNSRRRGSKSNKSTQTGTQTSTNTEFGSICDVSKKAKPIQARIRLFPDAGAVENPTVMATIKHTLEILWKKGTYQPKVEWWGQYSKHSGVRRDVDELDGTEQFRTFTGTEFLDLAKWWALKKFTPDQILTEERCNFPTPQAGQLLAIKAPLGGGKTYRSIEILKQLDRGAVILTPTNNLGKNFVGRATRAGLKYVYHLQTEAGRSMLRDKSASFVLCPDSIIHLDPDTFAGRIVIVDEAMQNWVAFLQRNTAIKNYRSKAIDTLKQGLAAAHSIVLLDGNLTDKGCEWWAEFAGKDVVKVVHHKTDAAVFDIQFLDAPDPAKLFHVMQKAALSNVEVNAVTSGRHPFAFVTDSKKDAIAAHERFEELGLKGYCLSSDTDNEPWVAGFLADADEFIANERPDYLILSPSGGSGLDINIRGYFSHVFQLGRGVNLCDDLSQHIARIRDPQAKRIVWVNSVGLPQGNPITETAEQQINAAIKDYLTADAAGAMGEQVDRLEVHQLIDSLIDQMKPHAPLIAVQNLETKHLRVFYREMLILAGHNVKTVDGVSLCKGAQSEQADMKLTHRMNHARAIEAAETITNQEAAKLQEKSGRNLQERTLLDRWRLLNDLPGIETSKEWQDETIVQLSKRISDEARYKFIDDLIENRMIQKARSFWMWQHPEETKLIQRDRWQKLLSGEEFKRLKSTELYLETLRRCGLEAVLNCDVISKDLPCVQNFLQNCRKKANRLKLGLSTKALNNSRLLSDLIEPLGMFLIQAEEHDGRSERKYRIESEIPRSVMDATGVKMTEKIEKINAEKVDPADRQNAYEEGVRGATGQHPSSYKKGDRPVADQEDQNSTVETQSVMDATGVKMTEKIEKINAEKVDPADRQNAYEEGVRGSAGRHSSSYKERRQTCAESETVETPIDAPPGWMDEESIDDIRALYDAADTDEARAALRQLIPPDVWEVAIAS